MSKFSVVRKGNISEALSIEWESDPLGVELWNILERAQQNPSQIVSRLSSLFERGSMVAASMLGEIFLYGDYDVPKDASKAENWFRLASDSGSLYGAYVLATMLEKRHEFQEALKIHRRLGDLDYGPSIYSEAIYYYRGMATGIDLEKAFQLFSRAADLGHIHSKLWGAFLLRRGIRGRLRILEGIVKWFPATFDLISTKFRHPFSDRLKI